MNGSPCGGLEVAAGSLASALIAQAGGAMRVELCGGLADGGLTPSLGSIAIARERLTIALHVLIRPRSGDFVFDADDIETMCRDIRACRQLGCNGVVIGALTAQGDVDERVCRRLIEEAGDLSVTFHRAFDVAADPPHALERIIALGCHRVLTSGAAARAIDGRERIAAAVTQAAGRIVIMPGAGIEAGHLLALRKATGAHEFHASASRSASVHHHANPVAGLDDTRQQTDKATVQRLVTILHTEFAG